MAMIKKLHKAVYEPIADLVTYRALPTRSIDYLDPFLFLNHHGPQVYGEHNNGLPFGPHPHRGMQTVTFILDGDIAHEDNGGHESVITAGGVQWMSAGRGLIHAEVSSDVFKKNGGPLEILQLWVNLPARSKMGEPFYRGLQASEIPVLHPNGDEGVSMQLVSGDWLGHSGAFESDINLSLVRFGEGEQLSLDIPSTHSIFFYVIKGMLLVNGVDVPAFNLAEFDHDGGESLSIVAKQASILLLGHAAPLNEPVVSQGPFVMNTQQEIMEAYADYRSGKFGVWKG